MVLLSKNAKENLKTNCSILGWFNTSKLQQLLVRKTTCCMLKVRLQNVFIIWKQLTLLLILRWISVTNLGVYDSTVQKIMKMGKLEVPSD